MPICAGEPHSPQNKYGKHIYSLEQFGLTEKAIAAEFAEYIALNDALEERCRPA